MLKKLRFSYKARPKDLQDDVVFEHIIDKEDVLVWRLSFIFNAIHALLQVCCIAFDHMKMDAKCRADTLSKEFVGASSWSELLSTSQNVGYCLHRRCQQSLILSTCLSIFSLHYFSL